MAERSLSGCRVLVVEDEYMLADELRSELLDAGADAIGPVASVEQAIDLIARDEMIDAAILDVNLGGEFAYPVADLLLERGIPFVFATGYDLADTPPRFANVVRCEKPINIRSVAQALGQ